MMVTHLTKGNWFGALKTNSNIFLLNGDRLSVDGTVSNNSLATHVNWCKKLSQSTWILCIEKWFIMNINPKNSIREMFVESQMKLMEKLAELIPCHLGEGLVASCSVVLSPCNTVTGWWRDGDMLHNVPVAENYCPVRPITMTRALYLSCIDQ